MTQKRTVVKNSHSLLVVISGKVQQVGLRKFIAKSASANGLAGWVQNVVDGTVRLLVAGPRSSLLKMDKSLAKTPAAVQIASMSVYRISRNPGAFKIHDKLKTAALELLFKGEIPEKFPSITACLKGVTDEKLTKLPEEIQLFAEKLKMLQQGRVEEQNAIKLQGRGLLAKFPQFRQQLLGIMESVATGYTVTHSVLRNAHNAGRLASVSSFRLNIALRTRKQFLSGMAACPEWKLNDKTRSYDFIDLLKVPRPKIIKQKFTYADLPKQGQLVIKPSAGAASKGVFLVFSETDIVEVKNAHRLTSLPELQKRMKAQLTNKVVAQDSWIAEELVMSGAAGKPANDLKFWCFYGEIVLVREVSRIDGIKEIWTDLAGTALETGQSYGETLPGRSSLSPAQLKLVKDISLAIPAPFMRIDFLLSNGELIFGEFTPRPGSFAQFNEQTDQMLGDHFLAAEARLASDLLNGKQFTFYQQYLKAQ